MCISYVHILYIRNTEYSVSLSILSRTSWWDYDLISIYSQIYTKRKKFKCNFLFFCAFAYTFYIKTIYTSVVPTLVYSFNLKRAMLLEWRCCSRTDIEICSRKLSSVVCILLQLQVGGSIVILFLGEYLYSNLWWFVWVCKSNCVDNVLFSGRME